MTASASVVDLKPCPFCGGEAQIERFGNTRVSTVYVCDECGCRLETGEEFSHGRSWNRRSTPHPAEQDAREAVIGAELDEAINAVENWTLGIWPDLSIGHVRTLLAALTQAAPDGWRLVPVKWTEVARYATEPGLTAYDRNSRMAEFRRIVTLEAVLSFLASPAPPAQGAGS